VGRLQFTGHGESAFSYLKDGVNADAIVRRELPHALDDSNAISAGDTRVKFTSHIRLHLNLVIVREGGDGEAARKSHNVTDDAVGCRIAARTRSRQTGLPKIVRVDEDDIARAAAGCKLTENRGDGIHQRRALPSASLANMRASLSPRQGHNHRGHKDGELVPAVIQEGSSQQLNRAPHHLGKLKV
jgi:hypothetical protein